MDEYTPIQAIPLSEYYPKYRFRWRQKGRGGDFRWKAISLTLVRRDQVGEIVRLIQFARNRHPR